MGLTADDREDDDNDSVHRVDTVPPPDGEGDAYSAETKVGPVSQQAWAEMIRKANEEDERMPASAPASHTVTKSSKPVSAAPKQGLSAEMGPSSAVVSRPPSEAAAPLPRLQYEEEEEFDDPTLLNPSATPELAAGRVRGSGPSAPLPPPLPTSLTGTMPSATRPLETFAAATPSTPPISAAPVFATPAAPPSSLSSPPRPVAGASKPPLAYLPGDPAFPIAPEPPPISRAVIVTALAGITIFLIGLTLFLVR